MKSHSSFLTALAVLALGYGGMAAAQTGANTGTTAGGASTSSGAGVVTSGTAAPAGQIPRANDTTAGKQPGGTGAGMAPIDAGKSPGAEVKTASTSKAKSSTAKKKSTKKKTTAKKKTDPAADTKS